MVAKRNTQNDTKLGRIGSSASAYCNSDVLADDSESGLSSDLLEEWWECEALTLGQDLV